LTIVGGQPKTPIVASIAYGELTVSTDSSKENRLPAAADGDRGVVQERLGVTYLSGDDHFSVEASSSSNYPETSSSELQQRNTKAITRGAGLGEQRHGDDAGMMMMNGDVGDAVRIRPYDGVMICLPFTSRRMCVRFVAADGQFWMRLNRASEITPLIRVSNLWCAL
jgi:hypothetical protein